MEALFNPYCIIKRKTPSFTSFEKIDHSVLKQMICLIGKHHYNDAEFTHKRTDYAKGVWVIRERLLNDEIYDIKSKHIRRFIRPVKRFKTKEIKVPTLSYQIFNKMVDLIDSTQEIKLECKKCLKAKCEKSEVSSLSMVCRDFLVGDLHRIFVRNETLMNDNHNMDGLALLTSFRSDIENSRVCRYQ